MWRVIVGTILALAAAGCLGLVVWRSGWWAGKAAARKELGIASQRRIKAQEALVNEAATIMSFLLSSPSVDLSEVTYLSPKHVALVEEWLTQKKRNDR